MKKIKERIERLGLNYKKELTFIILIAVFGVLLSVVSIIFTKKFQYLLIFLLLTGIIEFIYISRYKSLEEKQRKDVQDEFISVFSFFKIYIKNGMNVYTALKEVSQFVGPALKERFDKLLLDIDGDKSVEPFVKFAKTFDELIIEQMMISVYQMVDEGSDSPYFNQFEIVFNSLSNEMHEKELHSKESSLTTQSVAPLIGSALLIILITIGIVTVIGEMVSGL